jgi:hypothetical protein
MVLFLIKKYNGSRYYWLNPSPWVSGTNNFTKLSANGDAGYGTAINDGGVAPLNISLPI